MREGRIASKIFNGEILFGVLLRNENAAQAMYLGHFFLLLECLASVKN